MAKQSKAKAAAPVATATSKRSGYKRKGNKRIDSLQAQLESKVRKGQRAAQYDKSCTFAHPPAKD